MQQKKIILEFLGLTLIFKVGDKGILIDGNVVKETSKRLCPYCQNPLCYQECDDSQAPDLEECLETQDEMDDRRRYNTSIRFMISAIQNHAFEGIDIESDAYQKGWLSALCNLEEDIPID